MKRLGLLTVLLAGLMSFSLLIGCSGSDSGTGGDLTPGDTSDAAFQLAQELVGDEGDILAFSDDVELSLELFFEATGYGEVAADTSASSSPRIARMASSVDSVTNIVISNWQFTQDNWFVCTFSATQYQTECDEFGCDQVAVTLAGTDSLQFLMMGDPLDTSQMVNGFNEIRARAHVTVSGESPLGSINAAAHRWVNMAEDATNDSLVNVNAGLYDTLTVSFQGDSVSCDIVVTENGSIENLVVLAADNSDECPRAGSASTDATISLACLGTGASEYEQLDIEGAWSVNADIQSDGSVSVYYSDGTTQWTTTVEAGQCGDDSPTI